MERAVGMQTIIQNTRFQREPAVQTTFYGA